MENRSGQRRRRSLKQPIFRLAALLLSLAAALLAGEGLVRVVGSAPPVGGIDVSDPASPYRLCDNPILGYELTPGRPGINSYGQRDVEHTLEKPAGVRRVILLGDSVVEGITLETRWENLIAWHLQKLYDKSGTEVLNFGVRGYCTLAEVELFEKKGLQFKPDVVVLVFTDNDFRNFNADIALAGVRQRPAVVNWLFRNSDLFRILCLKTGIFHYGADADPTQWNKTAIGDDNVARGLARLKNLSQKHDFVPLIVIWPTFLDDRVIDRACLPGTDTPAIKVMADECGIPTLRLSGRLRDAEAARGVAAMLSKQKESHAAPKTNFRTSLTNGDTLHPNALGCKVAALLISQRLETLPPAQTQPTSRYAASRLSGAQAVAKSEAMSQWDYASALTLAGETLQNRGDAAAAIAKYEAALRVRPDDLIANVSLGRVLLQARGNLNRARECFERALRTDPSSADACNGLGVVLSRMGRAAEALDQFERAARWRLEFIEARHNLGMALMAAERPGEAVPHFRYIMQMHGDSPEAAADLGTALAAAGQTEEAIPCLCRALELRADYPQAQYALGNALARNGKNEEAVAHYEQALKLWPQAPEVHVNLGAALMAVGKTQEAIEHYRQALRLDNELPEAHNNLAVALASAGKDPEAIEHYRQAVRLRTDYVQAHYGLGLALNKAGLYRQAIEPLQRACELTGGRSAECLDALAVAYAGAGDFAQAAAAAEKALALAKGAGKTDLAKDIASRLDVYRSSRPPRR